MTINLPTRGFIRSDRNVRGQQRTGYVRCCNTLVGGYLSLATDDE